MATQKLKTKSGIYFCEKCGGSMAPRMLAVKKSKSFNFIKILQCNVCRHYIEINH